jgi:hypothetical protein
MNPQTDNSDVTAHGERVLWRIQLLTLGFGSVVAAVALALHRVDWAKGLLCGAALGWLNFRWLQSGIRGLFESALACARANPDGAETPVSGSNSAVSGMLRAFSLLFRYALVGAGVYVIFAYLHVPLVSIGLGLCALVAAIMAASVWEALQPES